MTDDGGSLLEGVYESLITEQLQRRLDHTGAVLASQAVPDGDEPDDHLAVASVVA